MLPSQNYRTEYTDTLGRSRVCLKKDLPRMSRLDKELRQSLASPHTSPSSRWVQFSLVINTLNLVSFSDHLLRMRWEPGGRVLFKKRLPRKKAAYCTTSKWREMVDHLVMGRFPWGVENGLVLALQRLGHTVSDTLHFPLKKKRERSNSSNSTNFERQCVHKLILQAVNHVWCMCVCICVYACCC